MEEEMVQANEAAPEHAHAWVKVAGSMAESQYRCECGEEDWH